MVKTIAPLWGRRNRDCISVRWYVYFGVNNVLLMDKEKVESVLRFLCQLEQDDRHWCAFRHENE